MKRIVILGCENSHAAEFLKHITASPTFSDVEVVGVYSEEAAAAQKLSDKYGVPILSSPEQAVGRVDGVVITARHGDRHFPYASPYIESGIPMFIDKPITIDEEEAVRFMRALRAHNVRISGGSSLKQNLFISTLRKEAMEEHGGKTVSGYVRAPLQSNSSYGGFFFYAQHLVEMVLEIFGRFPVAVQAHRNGAQIHVLFQYEDFDCVGLYCESSSSYYAARTSETSTHGENISVDSSCFAREFGEFYDLLSGGKGRIGYEEFISPVFVMNAIQRALNTGKPEKIRYVAL